MEYSYTVIGLSIVFSALFSGMEIAFISANKLRIELDRKQGTLASGIVNIFVSNPGQYIATMLVGNNIALVVYGIQMAKLLEPWLEGYFSNELSLLLTQTVISTTIILITAEFLPKSIFRLHPNGFLNFFALPMLFFYVVFYPISKVASWVSVKLIRAFIHKDLDLKRGKQIFGRVDLDHLVEEASVPASETESQRQEIRIFQNALEFNEIKVRECMIPRTDIEAVDVDSSIADLRQRFVETSYSRLLVYQGNIDNIIGYFKSKDLFRNPQSIKSKLMRIDFVPQTMLAHKLLTLFIKDHKSMAIVVDEFGGTAGLVTIEDIIEEIFGEIDDEHDSDQFIEKHIGGNEYIFSGRLEVDYLNDKYDLGIPTTDEYDTLAGFILTHHQSIPVPNTLILIDGFRIKVAKMVGTRIDLIHLSKLES
jgi:CBS domain containing-hemolysin-like protein